MSGVSQFRALLRLGHQGATAKGVVGRIDSGGRSTSKA
jgi:hypothetical protein